jgi:transcriptional regulator GlxA family with amidase domain
MQLVFDGVPDGPVGIASDILDTAARLVRHGVVNLGRGLAVPPLRLVSVDGRPVCTASGQLLHVAAALPVRGARRGDVLLLPGLGLATADQLTDALARRSDLARGIEAISRAGAHRATIGASCSATFLLAESGALDGQTATTTWWLAPAFAGRFPKVKLRPDRMVVKAGRVFTAGSAFAHADLLLALLTDLIGPALAHTVARYLVLDQRAAQSRYMVIEHLRSSDPMVVRLEHFVASNVGRRLRLAEMARAVGASPRTLARRVAETLAMTPQEFARGLRMAHAAHLVDTTRLSIDEIASRIGYADPAAFRRIFRRHTGETPRARRGSSTGAF